MDTTTALHYPDFETFSKLAAGADLVPVYRRLVSDALTPVTAFHKIDAGRCACLFESVVGGEKVGRYSFLATEPFFEIEAYGNRVTTSAPLGRFGGRRRRRWSPGNSTAPNPLDELRRRVEAVRAVHLPELPPFCSGAVGYAGYDTVRYFEHLPHAPPDDRQVPDMAFAFYDQMVVFDNVTKTIVVVAMARLDKPGVTRRAGLSKRPAGASMRWSSSFPSRPCDLQPFDIRTGGDVKLAYRSNFTQAEFEAAVRKCVEYIRAGDIFQVVLSQRLEVPLRDPALRDLPHAAGGQSQPVHVLPAHAERHAGRQLAGDHGAGGRRRR